MPSKGATHTFAPDGTCSECHQRHVNRNGRPTCRGHVRFDRDPQSPTYRARLDKPRPCTRSPRVGLERCVSHGAGSKKAAEAGRRRQQKADAEALALTLGDPVEGSDPADVIAERIDARRGHVRWLLARVRALEPEALTWGLTKRKTAVARDQDDDDRKRFAGTDEGDTHEAKPHIWYALYNESARELERLCVEAIRAGIEERRVRVDERMADMWVRVIDGILVALGHNPNDPATAEIVARHLELVA